LLSKKIITILPVSFMLLVLSGCSGSEEMESNSTSNNLVLEVQSSSANATESLSDRLTSRLVDLAPVLSEEAFLEASLQEIIPAFINEYVPKELASEVSSLEVLSINSLLRKSEVREPLLEFYKEVNTAKRDNSFYTMLSSLYETIKNIILEVISSYFSSSPTSSLSESNSSSSSVSSIFSSSSDSFSSADENVSGSEGSSSISSEISSSSSSVQNQNIEAIKVTSQTSDDVKNILKSDNDLKFSTIDPKITMAQGYGGIHVGVDENSKLVFMTATQKKNYQEHNMFFCKESTLTCKRVVDNSGEIHVGGVGVYAQGKIFFNTLDKTVNARSSIYGASLSYYDTKKDEFVRSVLALDDGINIGLNGETRTMTLGSDGYLYIGGVNFASQPHLASSARVNPNDLSDVTYYANYSNIVADRARSIAADDVYTYQVIGDSPYYLIALNRENGSAKKLNESANGKVLQLNDGAAFQYTDNNNVIRYFYLHNGELEEVETFNTQAPWYDPAIHPNNHPSDNPAGYWAWKSQFQMQTGVSYPQLKREGLSFIFPDEEGVGHASFSATKSDGTVLEFELLTDTYKQSVKEIHTLESGKILVSGTAYTGVSMLNPVDDSVKYLGVRHISISIIDEFYDYNQSKNRVVFEGYPSASAVVYDPEEKFSSENLQSLGYLRNLKDSNCVSDCNGVNGELGIHRALESVQIDETLFMVGMQYRTGVSGALLWWDTLSGKKAGIRHGIFDRYQPRSLINMEDKLVISTQAVDTIEYGGTARPSTPKIIMMDPITKEILAEYEPLKGLEAYDCGQIRSLDGRHIIGISNDQYANSTSVATKTYLYIIDTYSGETVMIKSIDTPNNMQVLPEGSAQTRGFDMQVHGDYIYTYMDSRTLIRIDKRGKVEKLGRLPFQGHFTFSDDALFFTVGNDILKVMLSEFE